jgi:hypothetical protein
MGDRAAFGFRAEAGEPTIYLYSHWGGSTQAADLARALAAAEPRWNDASYATRIAVSQLIGSEWAEETGYGLTVTDGRQPFGLDYGHCLVVDWAAGRVILTREGSETEGASRPVAEFVADPYGLVPSELADLLGV